MYQRKTVDVWHIQQYTGARYGWEDVSAAETWKEAKADLKSYRENQPEFPVRAIKRREKIHV